MTIFAGDMGEREDDGAWLKGERDLTQEIVVEPCSPSQLSLSPMSTAAIDNGTEFHSTDVRTHPTPS
jgi:hypothetical protein